MIIGIDFDGTCVKHAYPKIGEDIGAVPVLKEFVRQGHLLVLNSMRAGKLLEDAVQWFKDNGIELYGANHTPGQESWTQSTKTYANVYIDDAALGCPKTIDDQGHIFVDWRYISRVFGYDYDELCKKQTNGSN